MQRVAKQGVINYDKRMQLNLHRPRQNIRDKENFKIHLINASCQIIVEFCFSESERANTTLISVEKLYNFLYSVIAGFVMA